VSVVSITDRTVGLGNLRGTDLRASYPTILLKGGRLDAVVRFELWAADPASSSTAIVALQSRLLGARDTLRAGGFLSFATTNTSAAESVPTLNGWRQSIDLAVLYEYAYEDSDGAFGLIARIPAGIDSVIAESMLLTDEMEIWNHPDGAPAFVVDRESCPDLSGPGLPISSLAVLAYLPTGWDGHAVTITTSVGGVARQQVFPSVRNFVNSFALAAQPVYLGDNPYRAGTLAFPFLPHFPDPLVIQRRSDNLRISYADAAFDNVDAVVYLRALN
jgi:hypothetical protein